MIKDENIFSKNFWIALKFIFLIFMKLLFIKPFNPFSPVNFHKKNSSIYWLNNLLQRQYYILLSTAFNLKAEFRNQIILNHVFYQFFFAPTFSMYLWLINAFILFHLQSLCYTANPPLPYVYFHPRKKKTFPSHFYDHKFLSCEE